MYFYVFGSFDVFYACLLKMFSYKSVKKHVFYVFYLQINVFNIYALWKPDTVPLAANEELVQKYVENRTMLSSSRGVGRSSVGSQATAAGCYMYNHCRRISLASSRINAALTCLADQPTNKGLVMRAARGQAQLIATKNDRIR